MYNGLPELKLENFDDVDSKKKEDTIKNNEEFNSTFNHLSLNDDVLLAKRLLNTPIGVRSKAEKLQAQQRLDTTFSTNRSSKSWAYCLLSNTYALWFIYLPFYLESTESKVVGLNNTFKVFVKIQKQLLTQPDEVN